MLRKYPMLYSQPAIFQGGAGVIPLLGEAPAPTELCWCEVFQAILRFAWIELNDQLVVADMP